MVEVVAVDLTTLFGRIVSALRQEMKLSQAVFAEKLSWDRSLLARVESGRNTASIDNVYMLEEAFMLAGLLRGHGDLVLLSERAVREAQGRGFRVVVGRLPKPEGDGPVEIPSLDRIISRVVDDWLEAEEAEEEPDEEVAEEAEEEEDKPDPEPVAVRLRARAVALQKRKR
jgi:transcriptional regulator with XRE-family HTH domain